MKPLKILLSFLLGAYMASSIWLIAVIPLTRVKNPFYVFNTICFAVTLMTLAAYIADWLNKHWDD